MTEVFVVIEKYCLTEHDEDYKGYIIREIWSLEDVAHKRAKKLKGIAKAEGKDYFYVVVSHTLNEEFK